MKNLIDKNYLINLLIRIFSQKNKNISEIHNELNNYLDDNLINLNKTNDEEYLIVLEEYNELINEEDIEFEFDEENDEFDNYNKEE